jgi:hypothetical protein
MGFSQGVKAGASAWLMCGLQKVGDRIDKREEARAKNATDAM